MNEIPKEIHTKTKNTFLAHVSFLSLLISKEIVKAFSSK